ncbi:MAG: hypothetical protein ACRC67_00105 [Inquilinus sp.]|uniref:hypothetical protein n=1 Tax=Inquilinus sp. TaxID=1932117 RepID=UPI003F3AE48F
MHVETKPAATATAPCLAHGGGRIFSGPCRTCSAFAISCFPARPRRVTNEEIIAALAGQHQRPAADGRQPVEA